MIEFSFDLQAFRSLLWFHAVILRVRLSQSFEGYPFLRNIKVKAISISDINPAIVNDSFITISDRKKNTVLFNDGDK